MSFFLTLFLLLFFGAISFLETVDGYSGGAPCQAQHSLRPNPLYHGRSPNTLSPPYTFAILGKRGKQIKRYKPGNTYTIRLSGKGTHFRGFLIQARLATKRRELIGHLRAGYFKEEDSWYRLGIQIQKCPPIMKNSITHVSNDRKSEITAKWTVKNNVGPIQFYVTVVQEKTVYWTKWKPRTGFLLPVRLRKQKTSAKAENVPARRPVDEIRSRPPKPKAPSATHRNNNRVESGSAGTVFSAKAAVIATNRFQAANSPSGSETKGTQHSPSQRFPPPPSKSLAVEKTEESAEFGEDKEEDSQQVLGLRRLTFTKEDIGLLDLVDKDDVCKSNPCLNGGSCVNLKKGNGFACLCEEKFTGKLCETVNNCHRHECVYGECRNRDDGYTCKCYREYVGARCERHCPSYLCENSGTCVIDSNGEYGCICAEGWTGDRCHIGVNDCSENLCLNGAECIDLQNGYRCKCTGGFMGEKCHRPCQNIYKSCNTWEEENRCAAMRPITNFFDINCAVTCQQCTMDNSTIHTDTPLPPILEPFEFLIGEWVANYTNFYRYPIDFGSETVSSYIDKMVFSVPEVPMFGTPSVNFSAVATSENDSTDQIQNNGFLTLNSRSRASGRPVDIALISAGNDGITLIEEGKLEGQEMTLKTVYSAAHPDVQHLAYEQLQRTFTLQPPYLRVSVSKTKTNGKVQHYTKYYYRENPVTVF